MHTIVRYYADDKSYALVRDWHFLGRDPIPLTNGLNAYACCSPLIG